MGLPLLVDTKSALCLSWPGKRERDPIFPFKERRFGKFQYEMQTSANGKIDWVFFYNHRHPNSYKAHAYIYIYMYVHTRMQGGPYVLIPMTYDPGADLKYYCTVRSNKHVKLEEYSVPTKVRTCTLCVMHTCICIHVYIYMHTYIYIYIYICIYWYACTSKHITLAEYSILCMCIHVYVYMHAHTF